jgi:hypothetical protein
MLPNCVIIGAMKCGTTSLHSYLNQHPDIFMSSEKELSFFGPQERWSRGVAWYESQFPDCGKTVYGESSTIYAAFPQYTDVPQRMASVIPAAKLVYLVRDPIDRIVSEYRYRYWRRWESRPFREAVTAPGPNTYVDRSSYWMQLERFLACFDASQIHVVDAHALREKRAETLATIFEFLGVAPFDSRSFARNHNESAHHYRRKRAAMTAVSIMDRVLGRELSKAVRRRTPEPLLRRIGTPVPVPQIDDGLHAWLVERLEFDCRRLRAFSGLRFPSWQL